VALQFWEKGGIADIPSRQDLPVPPAPAEKLQAAEYRTYITEKRKAEKANRELHSRRCDTSYKLEIAKAVRALSFCVPLFF